MSQAKCRVKVPGRWARSHVRPAVPCISHRPHPGPHFPCVNKDGTSPSTPKRADVGACFPGCQVLCSGRRSRSRSYLLAGTRLESQSQYSTGPHRTAVHIRRSWHEERKSGQEGFCEWPRTYRITVILTSGSSFPHDSVKWGCCGQYA